MKSDMWFMTLISIGKKNNQCREVWLVFIRIGFLHADDMKLKTVSKAGK